ncbi:hypothetical protein ACHAP8_012426 [Fusarium lateritium]
MVLLKHFIFIIILALIHLVIASPAQQCQKRSHVGDHQFELWNNYWRDDGQPTARVHIISSDELLDYDGVPVLPARPLQPRSLIHGIDDRKEVVSNEYPFNIIRKLFIRSNTCTGSAVGPRHFMTARHCISRKPALIKLKSKHGQYPRTYETESYVTDIIVVQATASASCESTEDFAILIFDEPIFETEGYFGAKQFDYNFDPIFKHTGFPYMNGRIRHIHQDDIQVTGYQQCGRGLELTTETDINSGQSGGPLYTMENGYAVQVGVLCCYGNEYGTFFASGMNVVSSIAYARHNFP